MPTSAKVRESDSGSSRTALVVGAGIGGLSAACALRLAGWQVQVQVLEQAQRLEPVGAGITLWPNAVRALNVLGVHPPDGVSRPGTSGLRASSGRWLSRSDTADYPVRYGAPLIAVHRADLQQALLAALPVTTVTTGTRVTAIDQDDTGVTVQHSAGRSRAALVVLADGLAPEVAETGRDAVRRDSRLQVSKEIVTAAPDVLEQTLVDSDLLAVEHDPPIAREIEPVVAVELDHQR